MKGKNIKNIKKVDNNKDLYEEIFFWSLSLVQAPEYLHKTKKKTSLKYSLRFSECFVVESYVER